MKTTRSVVLLLALAIATPLAAQGPVVARKAEVRERDWTAVRIAKWALLGGAIGFGAYALQHSRTAEHTYAELRARCQADPSVCATFNGSYTDPTSEALYQRSIAADRRAQVGIFGGQVAVLGSVGLFIYDLKNGRGPSDIPYPARRSIAIGARLTW